jgi:hypothetical protein
MTPTRALALLLLASCATTPNPPPAPPARTTARPTKAQADTAQQPKIVKAQALMLAEPVTISPELMAPRGALAPRTGVLAPETVGPAPVGEIPPLLIVRPPKGPETPEPASPETTKPPPPVIVNPPNVDERETEEASRRKDRPPKPNEVRIADPDWQPDEPAAPRYRPCSYVGEGGPGPSRPEKAPSDWVHCRYRCGRYEVHLNDMRFPKPEQSQTKDKELALFCKKWLRRAEDHARSFDEGLRARGL